MELILVKWGGSLITEKSRPSTPRASVLERLAQELVAGTCRADSDSIRVILGHGSGSFGHAAAKQVGMTGPVSSRRPFERSSRQGAVRVRLEAERLHNMVSRTLVSAGISPWTWVPSTALTATRGRPGGADLSSLYLALDQGFLPVTYGDVLVDSELGASIASTEALIRFLVSRLHRRGRKVSRLLWMGESPGIYDRGGRTIPNVDLENINRVWRMIGAPRGIDVTGGMALRLRTAWALAQAGVSSWILDGTVPGLFEAALAGEQVPGTKVSASL